jgi:hypothetical protein
MSATADLLQRDPATAGPDPEVIAALLQACEEANADPTERLALFAAGMVASNLRHDHEDGDRLGVFGQNSFWGPAAARRDPRTAAEVFLREARRILNNGGPRSAARLAVRVQGEGSVLRHHLAARTARHLLADTLAPTVEALPAVAPVAAEA